MIRFVLPIFLACLLVGTALGQVEKGQLIDETGDLSCENSSARADAAASQLKENTTAKLALVYYVGFHPDNIYDKTLNMYEIRQNRPIYGQALFEAKYFRLFLFQSLGPKHRRVEIIDGGFRENFSIQIWLLKGNERPVLSPTLTRQGIRFKRGKIKGKLVLNCGY